MYHITREAEYNTACLSTGREVFPRVAFTTLSPRIIVTKKNIQSISLNEIVNNTQETISMGCTCANKIKITFIQEPTDKVLDRIGTLTGQAILVQCGLRLAGGLVAYAPLGNFYISDVETSNNGNSITITAYDGMGKLNVDYDPQVDLTLADLQDVYDDLIDQIDTKCNMVLKPRTIPREEKYRVVQINRDDSLLKTLGYVAGMLGGFARVDRNGQIEICSSTDTNSKWYEDTQINITRELQYFNALQKTTDETKKITTVESGVTNYVVSSGLGLPGVKLWFDCPYMTQGAVDDILNAVKNKEYQPSQLEWVGNPLIQAGDSVDVMFSSSNEVTVNANTFAGQITNSGRYEFIYNGLQWEYNGEEITLGNYGIAITHPNVVNGDYIVVDFTAGETPRAKCQLIYKKSVLIMEHTLTIDGGMKDEIVCYGQSQEDQNIAWNYESASNAINKIYGSLNEAILAITSNITGGDGGYVILHKRGDQTSYTTTITNGSVAVNSAYFADHFHIEGNYVFTYSGNHWTYGNEVVDIESVGISVNGTPATDDTITVNLSFTAEYPDEILVMDTQAISTSQNIWRFNQNGLAHSSHGYDGPYTTAITQDGQIVGSFLMANSLSLNQLRPEVVTQITSNLVNHAEFNEFSDSVYQQIQQAESEAVQLSNDELTEYKNKVAQYLTFNGENGLMIGAVNSNFKTNLTNTKLSFVENNNEVAYVSNQEFFITNGNILSRLNIGNFKFVPRSNGNLSLVYEEVNS